MRVTIKAHCRKHGAIGIGIFYTRAFFATVDTAPADLRGFAVDEVNRQGYEVNGIESVTFYGNHRHFVRCVPDSSAICVKCGHERGQS